MAYRHDRRAGTVIYNAEGSPTVGEAEGRNWRPEAGPTASWSSARRLDAPVADRDPSRMVRRTAPAAGSPQSAAWPLKPPKVTGRNGRSGHQGEDPA